MQLTNQLLSLLVRVDYFLAEVDDLFLVLVPEGRILFL
jgi:hypothetical protein